MRIIHTSDWHIGRTLHGISLREAHQTFIDGLVEQTLRARPDCVLVSGDFFDRSVPAHDHLLMARDALLRLTEVAPVIVTSGNHDSSVRLGWLKDFVTSDLRLCTRADQVDVPVFIRCMERDGNGQPLDGQRSAIVDEAEAAELAREGAPLGVMYPVPYLHPDMCREALSAKCGADIGRSHQAVMTAVMDLIADNYRHIAATICPQGLPIVVAAHAFVTGGEESASERSIDVGGVNDISSQTFVRHVGPHPHDGGQEIRSGAFEEQADGEGDLGASSRTDTGFVDYVALGHLHRPQRLRSGGPTMAYCGSPIAFDFSESTYEKTQLVVDIDHGDEPVLTPFAVPVFKRVMRIKDSVANLTPENYPAAVDAWVEVSVTDDSPPVNMYSIIRHAFPNALRILRAPLKRDDDSHPISSQEVAQEKPIDVTTGFLETFGGRQLSDEEKQIVRDIFEQINAEHGDRV